MAHFWKYKLNDVKGVLDEALRTTKEDGEFKVKALRDGHIIGNVEDNTIFRHQDFDTLFSKVKKQKFQEEDTIEEGKIKTHATKVLGGILITLPKEYKEEPRERQEEFFERCDDLLVRLFGEKYCVFSGVHYDETTPHMHFYFIPAEERARTVTKTGRVREAGDYLNAKSVMSHEVLTAFHDRLDGFLKNTLDWYRGGIVLSPEDRAKESLASKDFKEVKENTERLTEELREASTALSRVNQRRAELDEVAISEKDMKRIEKGKLPKDAKAISKMMKDANKRMEEANQLMKSAAEKSVALDFERRQFEDDRAKLEEREQDLNERESKLYPTEQALQNKQDYLTVRERDLDFREKSVSRREAVQDEKDRKISKLEGLVDSLNKLMDKMVSYFRRSIWRLGDDVKKTNGFKEMSMDMITIDRDAFDRRGTENRGNIVYQDTQAKENEARGETYEECLESKRNERSKTNGFSLTH